MKNTLEETNSRITEAEEWMSELEDRMVEKHKIKKKETERNKGSFRDLWDNIKYTNIQIVEGLE